MFHMPPIRGGEVTIARLLVDMVDAGQAYTIFSAAGCHKFRCIILVTLLLESYQQSIIVDLIFSKILFLIKLLQSIGMTSQTPCCRIINIMH